jgi:hypothetical protein
MFSKEELKIIKKYNTPSKIQDFINSLKTNFEEKGETCQSPSSVLKSGKAHCMEGAMLAAAMLRVHGFTPLLVDLETTNDDYDHVLAVFQQNGHWGAITKTNHAVLRYREPVYRTIRELVMSYFHEYFLNSSGKKTLRKFSDPVNLEQFDKFNWMASEDEVWFIPDYLARVKHFKILSRSQIRGLRKADEVEIKAGELVDEPEPAGFSEPLYSEK